METTLEKKELSQIAVIAQSIDTGLQAFEKRKSELLELEKEAHGLKINDIEDRETLNSVSIIRKKLKSARVEIQKEGKMMRDPLTNISRQISDKEKELIAIIEPTEKDLLAQEKWVEDEKERIRLEELAKEEARIQVRIDKLSELGFQIDYADIKPMSDEMFDKYYEAAKSQHEKELEEQKRIESERLAQAESERLARIEEQNRIDAERKELEDLRAKQAEAQKIIDEQNAKIESEKKAIEDEKRAIEAAKQKAIDDKKRADDLEAFKKQAAIDAKNKAIADAKEAERLKLEREEKERVAAEKKALRQPDKKKIMDYVAALKSVQPIALNTDEAKALFSRIVTYIDKLEATVNEELSKM